MDGPVHLCFVDNEKKLKSIFVLCVWGGVGGTVGILGVGVPFCKLCMSCLSKARVTFALSGQTITN